MSNYDDYVKDLEKQNEALMQQNEVLQESYNQLERFFVLSSMTDMKGRKLYNISVKGENTREITEEDYSVLKRMHLECEPHVDMRKKYDHITASCIEDLNKIISEGIQKLKEYQ
jgi:hypothetical protein